MDGTWRRLSSLRLRGNTRRRALGRLWYCETDPRRLYLVQARARDRKGKWGLWYLLSNRPLSAQRMVSEYGLRFTCEEGFRDAKRLLGFAHAQIACLQAWARMFTLVAIALVVLVNIGLGLLQEGTLQAQLRRVRSRRRARSEVSLVRAVVELLRGDRSLWKLLDHRVKLNLEASL